MIGKKLARAISAGLRPILCVGELLAERESGRAVEVVATQLRGALAGKDMTSSARRRLRHRLRARLGHRHRADRFRAPMPRPWPRPSGPRSRPTSAGARPPTTFPVLYGGSVTSANIGEFLAEHSIDGGLVGGASLKPDEMAGMVARAAVTARARAAAEGKPA